MEIRKIDSSANDLIDGSSQDKSLLAAKIQKLHIFFSLLIPDMSHEERQLLDESLIQTYNKRASLTIMTVSAIPKILRITRKCRYLRMSTIS